jgi:Mg/Co/Ni transporter MgtE
MCEGKLYTPKQLVDSLYKKNQDRREKIFNTLKDLNIEDVLEDVLENDEVENIDELKKLLKKLIFDDSSVVGQHIMNKINEVTNIDGYREYQDEMNEL